MTIADGTYFFYAHMSAFAPGLSVGSAVKAGQIIGQVGMTGDAPIPHLHFEVHPGGGASVNPTPYVKAVDGCKTSAVPPQPGDVVPGTDSPRADHGPACRTDPHGPSDNDSDYDDGVRAADPASSRSSRSLCRRSPTTRPAAWYLISPTHVCPA